MTSWQNGMLTKLTICQNDLLSKWQVGKMTSFQNGMLTKQQVDKKTSWQNDRLSKLVGELASW
jgi:hypothetical protein